MMGFTIRFVKDGKHYIETDCDMSLEKALALQNDMKIQKMINKISQYYDIIKETEKKLQKYINNFEVT